MLEGSFHGGRPHRARRRDEPVRIRRRRSGLNFEDPFGLECKDRNGKDLPEKACHPDDKPLERPAVDPVAIAADVLAGAVLGLAEVGVEAGARILARPAVAGAGRLAEELLPQVGRQGVDIAGGTATQAFRQAGDYATRFGGEAADYIKRATVGTVDLSGGAKVQLHYVENVKTGAIFDIKLKFYVPK